MNIGVLGSGVVAKTLAAGFLAHGHETMMGTRTAAKLAEYKGHIAKWSEDLKEESDTAKEYEAEVKRAEAKAVRFDIGEALLQISVVLSSITLFTRRRSFFAGGLLLGAIGLVVAASAWLV